MYFYFYRVFRLPSEPTLGPFLYKATRSVSYWYVPSAKTAYAPVKKNASGLFTDTDVEEDEKYECRRGAFLLASSILKDYNTVLRNNF